MQLMYNNKRLVYVFNDTDAELTATADLPTRIGDFSVDDCYFGRFRADKIRGALGLHFVLSRKNDVQKRQVVGCFSDLETIDALFRDYEISKPDEFFDKTVPCCLKGGEVVGIAEPKRDI